MAEVAERSTVEILKSARERITPEEAWTTQVSARNAQGERVDTDAKDAVCWCALGSLFVECGASVDNPSYSEGCKLLTLAIQGKFKKASLISTVNDWEGHDAILWSFDAAIQLAEQEAPDA